MGFLSLSACRNLHALAAALHCILFCLSHQCPADAAAPNAFAHYERDDPALFPGFVEVEESSKGQEPNNRPILFCNEHEFVGLDPKDLEPLSKEIYGLLVAKFFKQQRCPSCIGRGCASNCEHHLE